MSRCARLKSTRLLAVIALVVSTTLGGLLVAAPAGAALPFTITGPNAVFGLPNLPVPFTATDPISGDSRTISTDAKSDDGTCDAAATPPVDTGCVVAYLQVDASAGLLSYDPTGVDPTTGDPTGGASLTINGTATAINTALSTLVFTPANNYQNLPSTPARLQVDIRDKDNNYTGDGSPDNSKFIDIRIAPLDSAPVNTVPSSPQAVAGNSVTPFTGNQFKVADSDVNKGETDDVMLLVMFTTCGKFDISGGSFQIGDDIKNLLKNQAGLNSSLVDAIYALLPNSIKSLSLSTSGTDVSAVAGIGSLSEVNDALSTVTYHAPSGSDTCHLWQVISDLGNNGLPLHYINISNGPGDFPHGYEVPNPLFLFDVDNVEFDIAGGSTPTVTINQAVGQNDPTTTSPINFDVVFSEDVTGFDSTDVVLTGTAGATTATVTPNSATSYTVHATGMTTSGTVIATIPAGAATAAALSHNPSAASTSTDNTVTYQKDLTATINQGAAQVDPTSSLPINFDVAFSEPVTGFDNTDVALSGTASAGATVTVTPVTTSSYTVSVSNVSVSGTIIASVPAGAATSIAGGQGNDASTSKDNSVTYTLPPAPSVTINQGATQVDPTSTLPIVFDVVFSEPVTGFTNTDVSITGTASAGVTETVTANSATSYTVDVSNVTVAGTITAAIPAGAATSVATSDPSTASTSTDNTVTYTLPPAPSVTINQGATQVDPTSTLPIVFDVVFSEPVTGFTNTDVSITGTASAGVTTTVTPVSASAYTVSVSNVGVSGLITATIGAGAATSIATSEASTASTSTDNTVTYNRPADPSVTINQGATQTDPTTTLPIVFDVVFSENVSGFAANDVTLTGTASSGATKTVTSLTPSTYTVTVSNVTVSGTIIASIPAGAAVSTTTSQASTASTSTDNSVTYNAPVPPTVTINQGATQADPTSTLPIVFDVLFSVPVTGFTASGVVLTGTASAGTHKTVHQLSGAVYTVSVTGLTKSGTIRATVIGGAATAILASLPSTSTDNTVTYHKPVKSSPTPTPTKSHPSASGSGSSSSGSGSSGSSGSSSSAGSSGAGAGSTTAGGNGTGGVLASTGTATRTDLILALLLIAGGCGLVALGRRRGQHRHQH